MKQNTLNSRGSIKEFVEDLVDTYRTRDPHIIAKKNNIIIKYKDLGEIKGFFREMEGISFVAINENLSEFMTKMVLAHELGHYFLHKDYHDELIDIRDNFLGYANYIEKEANKFAAFLIMDLESLNSYDIYFESEEDKKVFENLSKLILE